MAEFHYTYIITNTANGKYYIGKHSTRSIDDGYMGSGKLLKLAIKEYGIDNFKKDIIAFYDSTALCTSSERDMIRKNINDPMCYNIYVGGSEMPLSIRRKISAANKGRKHSMEARMRMSASRTGLKISEAGRLRLRNRPLPSDETKRKMSLAQSGKTLSEDHKEKIKQKLLGSNNYMHGRTGVNHHNSKSVMMINKDTGDTIMTFESCEDAAKYCNGGHQLISRCARNDNFSGYGYKWKYTN